MCTSFVRFVGLFENMVPYGSIWYPKVQWFMIMFQINIAVNWWYTSVYGKKHIFRHHIL